MKLFQSLLLGLFLLAGVSANAQEKKDLTPEQRADRMTIKISEHLSLNEDKTAQLKTLNTDFMKTIYEIKADESLSKEDRVAKAQEAKDSHKVELKSLFSEEEYKKFEELEANKAERIEDHKVKMNMSPELRADMFTKHMVESLDLTETQAEQIGSLNLKVEEKIQAIRDNDSMTPEKKKEFIKGNREDQRRSFKTILTPEQMEKLKELKKEHGHGDHHESEEK